MMPQRLWFLQLPRYLEFYNSMLPSPPLNPFKIHFLWLCLQKQMNVLLQIIVQITNFQQSHDLSDSTKRRYTSISCPLIKITDCAAVSMKNSPENWCGGRVGGGGVWQQTPVEAWQNTHAVALPREEQFKHMTSLFYSFKFQILSTIIFLG